MATAYCRVAAGDSFATFSNYGSLVDIIAPGVNIYSTYKSKGYATMSGTSMASPHVAGAAALVLQANPTYSPAQVRTALLGVATNAAFAVPADTATKILNVLPF